MTRYSIEPRTRKYVKRHVLLSFARKHTKKTIISHRTRCCENIRFKTLMLKSYLCDYSDAYIVVKGTTDLLAVVANENDKAEKDVAFKNNASFRSCI